VTTSGPAVIVAFVAYENYDLGDPSDVPDVAVINVSSPSLGGFQRRAVQIMQPEWVDRGTNCILKTELWWAPAPTPLTNEIVTADLGGIPILGTIVVYAVEGFSATGIMTPWDCVQTVMFAIWNSDPGGPVGAPHFYTGHADGMVLQFSVMDPMKTFPDPVSGYDYTGLDAVLPGVAPSILLDAGFVEEGFPVGSMGYQTCAGRYFTQFSNAYLDGNLMTFNGQLAYWPQWMFMADALYFH
jgi:hypothetical protein